MDSPELMLAGAAITGAAFETVETMLTTESLLTEAGALRATSTGRLTTGVSISALRTEGYTLAAKIFAYTVQPQPSTAVPTARLPNRLIEADFREFFLRESSANPNAPILILIRTASRQISLLPLGSAHVVSAEHLAERRASLRRLL